MAWARRTSRSHCFFADTTLKLSDECGVSQTSVRALGFYTGPGNTLLDHWLRTLRSMDYNTDEDWASCDTINHNLLSDLVSDLFFDQPFPKSIGTDYFNLDWLRARSEITAYALQDIQSKLTEFTASTIATTITRYCPAQHELLIWRRCAQQQSPNTPEIEIARTGDRLHRQTRLGPGLDH